MLIAVILTNTCSWRCNCRQHPSHALAREPYLIDSEQPLGQLRVALRNHYAG
jgi:hypothetical protein